MKCNICNKVIKNKQYYNFYVNNKIKTKYCSMYCLMREKRLLSIADAFPDEMSKEDYLILSGTFQLMAILKEFKLLK